MTKLNRKDMPIYTTYKRLMAIPNIRVGKRSCRWDPWLNHISSKVLAASHLKCSPWLQVWISFWMKSSEEEEEVETLKSIPLWNRLWRKIETRNANADSQIVSTKTFHHPPAPAIAISSC
jgi:hypothetical protein